MKFKFEKTGRPKEVPAQDWQDWKWQMRSSLRTPLDFESFFSLSEDERSALKKGQKLFRFQTTPYYARLCKKHEALRKMTLPSMRELKAQDAGLLDPLGERKNQPTPRIIHRYPDRVLFLITDFCGIYCRYCTRKHFTGKSQARPSRKHYEQAVFYIKKNKGLREVILSGGDPLTLSDSFLKKILFDLRAIEHIEIIRIASRLPAVCPFRITPELVSLLKTVQPVFIMTHFNHPKEITDECRRGLLRLTDGGLNVYNQMVLLNGVNNHPALVQALNRRLLYLRVQPYYMFQCDPSQGTDHFRTTIENSKWIQKKLWNTLSGLATPKLSMDLPGGGGKVELTPSPFIEKKGRTYFYEGFDGMKLGYKNPISCKLPPKKEMKDYLEEWKLMQHQPYGGSPHAV